MLNIQEKSMAVRNKLGQSIRILRKKSGYTLDELAFLSGMSSKTLARIEKAETSITLDKLFDISSVLGVPSYEILQSACRFESEMLYKAM